VSYFRATDPFPLESAEQNKLHEFYAHLAAGRLVTSACRGCRRLAWPPRGFCPECGADELDWAELPREGTVHAFSVQETGVPPGFTAPLVFAIVKLGGLRLFAPVLRAEAAAMSIGAPVRFTPIRVADDSAGAPRYLVAFEPARAS
jgi:uncharacterized OB-fold protein